MANKNIDNILGEMKGWQKALAVILLLPVLLFILLADALFHSARSLKNPGGDKRPGGPGKGGDH